MGGSGRRVIVFEKLPLICGITITAPNPGANQKYSLRYQGYLFWLKYFNKP
jgi:hypothetical protein